YFVKSTDDDSDGGNRDSASSKGLAILKLTAKLRKTAFKNSVMEQCKVLFLDKKFESLLDSNKNLVGFDNGVFDLVSGRFRDGMPDDCLTFSVGYNYKEYKMKDQKVVE